MPEVRKAGKVEADVPAGCSSTISRSIDIGTVGRSKGHPFRRGSHVGDDQSITCLKTFGDENHISAPVGHVNRPDFQRIVVIHEPHGIPVTDPAPINSGELIDLLSLDFGTEIGTE
jgi:hypothetical protein